MGLHFYRHNLRDLRNLQSLDSQSFQHFPENGLLVINIRPGGGTFIGLGIITVILGFILITVGANLIENRRQYDIARVQKNEARKWKSLTGFDDS